MNKIETKEAISRELSTLHDQLLATSNALRQIAAETSDEALASYTRHVAARHVNEMWNTIALTRLWLPRIGRK